MVEIKASQLTYRSFRVLNATSGSELRVVKLESVYVKNRSFTFFISKCFKLVSLELGDLPCVTGATVEAIAGNCPLLEKLIFMCYLNITDLSVPFISSLLHLRELDVTFCYGITISGLQTLVKGVPNLESFCFKIGKKADQDTDPAVVFQSLGRFCPRLRALKCRSEL